jgi:hypothetical protein
MRIVQGRPPNYDEINEVFGPLPPNTVFAYGDTIYKSSSEPLSDDLVAHEHTHLRQQEQAGGPDNWWGLYISDWKFRLEVEVEAYRVQLASISNKRQRRQTRRRVARDLASPMYGGLVTTHEAFALLS